MKKKYDEPEFELIILTLKDSLLNASAEGGVNQGVGNGDPDGNGPIE